MRCITPSWNNPSSYTERAVLDGPPCPRQLVDMVQEMRMAGLRLTERFFPLQLLLWGFFSGVCTGRFFEWPLCSSFVPLSVVFLRLNATRVVPLVLERFKRRSKARKTGFLNRPM
ncbi:hypothetical protein BKA82DRAFT_999750, partial [Pisolithus tinctorius]